MKYRVNVISVSELGQRNNQEDSIFPAAGTSTADDRLFVLCDGMGGHECGEVASSTVCDALRTYVDQFCSEDRKFTSGDFDGALSAAFDALDSKDDGAERKMGTTMTFLKLHSEGCFVAHIGDSRIYHIRPSEIGADRLRFVSRDHSLINDLIDLGELTEQDALNSGQKNVITRAMQPMLDPRPKADVRNISDIQPGDYFYMCSDGMLEQMDDMELADILSMEDNTDEEKMEVLLTLTAENRDNHSAHLIRIIDVEYDAIAVESDSYDEPEAIEYKESLEESQPYEQESYDKPSVFETSNVNDEISAISANKSGLNKNSLVLIVIVFVLLGVIGYFLYDKFTADKEQNPGEKIENTGSGAPAGKVNQQNQSGVNSSTIPDSSSGMQSGNSASAPTSQTPMQPVTLVQSSSSQPSQTTTVASVDNAVSENQNSTPESVAPEKPTLKYIKNKITFGSETLYTMVKVGNFYIGQTEVTCELWDAVMNGSSSQNRMPKTNVSYNDCIAFVKKLSEITGKNFTLPTVDQWKTAATGGEAYDYSGSDDWKDVAVNGKLSAVSSKKANKYGLYDMSGNVREWCSGSVKIPVKGGSFKSANPEEDYKCSSDTKLYADTKDEQTGFRLVLKQYIG